MIWVMQNAAQDALRNKEVPCKIGTPPLPWEGRAGPLRSPNSCAGGRCVLSPPLSFLGKAVLQGTKNELFVFWVLRVVSMAGRGSVWWLHPGLGGPLSPAESPQNLTLAPDTPDQPPPSCPISFLQWERGSGVMVLN